MGQFITGKDTFRTEFVFDKQFYNNVYKRTERIVAGVFFTLGLIRDINENEKDILIDKIKETATALLTGVATLLMTNREIAHHKILILVEEALLVSSLIEVAIAGHRIQESHGSMLRLELDMLVREVSEALEENSDPIRRKGGSDAGSSLRARRQAPGIPSDRDIRQSVYGDTASVTESGKDRKERILDILRDKGQIGIKDIVATIKDVSEKSIQRDLNSLIYMGKVVRNGDRRWSTYSMVIQ